MAAADRSAKDKQMAAYMKQHKIERTSGKCCICYDTIGNEGAAYNHYSRHSRGVTEKE